MARGVTIHRFWVALSDVDRGVYESLDFRPLRKAVTAPLLGERKRRPGWLMLTPWPLLDIRRYRSVRGNTKNFNKKELWRPSCRPRVVENAHLRRTMGCRDVRTRTAKRHPTLLHRPP
jgi:hypothetical protein